MIVLGHRVLIRPDEQPEPEDGVVLLDGGASLNEEERRIWRGAAHKDLDREFVATSGTVLQVGAKGSRWRFDVRQKTIAQIAAVLAAELDLREKTAFYAGLKRAVEMTTNLLSAAEPSQDVQVGDRVAFDADHGVALTVAGEPYLILEHDDVVVIVNESEAAA